MFEHNFFFKYFPAAWLCVCMNVLINGSASCQQLNFDYYSKVNGLVDQEVHSITQGANHLMYFGTPSGFSVFDGGMFRNYDRENGFRYNFISGIKETENQQMVILTGGNAYYHFDQQKLIGDSFPGKVTVKNIYPLRSGITLACSNSGLYIYNKGNLSRLPLNSGRSYQGINCVLEWQDSLLIVGRSYEPLEIYRLRDWKKVASSAENLFVRSMCADKEGNVWIATIGAGIRKLESGSIYQHGFSFEKLPDFFNPFQHAEFRSIVLDHSGNLWMGSVNRGLLMYHPQTEVFLNISMDQGLVSNSVFSLYCDYENNIWIGTNRGLQKLVHQDVFTLTSKQGLPADLVLDAMPLSGQMVVTCGYLGVGFIRGPGRKVTSWQPPLNDEYFLKYAMYQNTCYGLSLKKLIALEIRTDRIKADKIYPLPEHVRTMLEYHNDGLLLGGDSSIRLFRNGKLQLLVKDSVHYISCMALDDSGKLWTGNLRNEIVGFQFQQKRKIGSAVPIYRYGEIGSSAEDYKQSLVCDKQNRIICGSYQSGITVFTIKQGKLNRLMIINTSNGLSSNNVIALTWYNDSTLLVGTGRGLDKITFVPNSIGYKVSNINDYYNFSSSVYSIRKSDHGNILLGTESGMIRIPGIDIDREMHRSLPVIISSVSLLSHPDSSIDFHQMITLPYDDNGLMIHFASPSFTNDQRKRFVYKMEGAPYQVWSPPVFTDNLVFSNLPPGRYRFLVKALNLWGEISVSEASVDILIRPPFWQRTWFYLICILAIITTVLLVIRRKIKNIQYAADVKGRIAEAEMMALRSQMNPHFIFNCMNIIDSLITSKRGDEAQEFLHKFSKLIRLVLENSMHPLVPLQQDLQALELYIELEVIRNNHRFTYTIKVDEELIEEGYKIPPLLLQPFVENAIIHGLRHKEKQDGKLFIEIKKENSEIVITIEDNGIGRTNSFRMNRENQRPQKHLGMEVTGKRITLLQIMTGKKVGFTTEDILPSSDTGTRVRIVLPIQFEFETDVLN